MTTNLYITGFDMDKEDIAGYQIIDEKNLNLKDLRELHPGTVILNAHGTVMKFPNYYTDEKNILYRHQVQIGQNTLYSTHTILEAIANGKPINVVLLSCFSGTRAEELAHNLASGSAVITTSKEHKMSYHYLEKAIIQSMGRDSEEDNKNFAQVFLDNLPIFAASFAKFITPSYSFAIKPNLQALTSRKNAGDFLERQQHKFISEINQNNILKELYQPLELKKFSESEIDLFIEMYLVYLSLLGEEHTIDFLRDHWENDYLKFLVKNSHSESPILVAAAAEGNAETVKILIKMGGDVNQADKQGCSPLIIAAQNGHVGVVKMLIKMGADVTVASLNIS